MAYPQIIVKINRSGQEHGLSARAILPFVALFGIQLALISPVFAQSTTLPSANTLSTPSTVVAPIGPGDILHISVVGQSELSTDYEVDAGGDITMLYVSKVHVGGLTPDKATSVVKEKLSSIYVDPIVTLTRSAMGGNSITVTGAVQHQGSEAARRDSTLNDVIQMATPQTDADLTKIQITRGMPGQSHSTDTYDLASFLNSGDFKNNPGLADGDVIFVPSKAAVTYSVSCVGAVAKPGRFYVPPGETVADLITTSGGLNADADKANIYIQPNGTTEHRTFDYTKATQDPANPTVNPQLSDGDEVVVSELQIKPIVTITGGVLKPGQYPIDGRMSLTDAIGVSGGLQDRAQVAHTTVTRLDGKGGTTVVNLDARDATVCANFMLQPGDNIVIPAGHPSRNISPLDLLNPLGFLFQIFR